MFYCRLQTALNSELARDVRAHAQRCIAQMKVCFLGEVQVLVAKLDDANREVWKFECMLASSIRSLLLLQQQNSFLIDRLENMTPTEDLLNCQDQLTRQQNDFDLVCEQFKILQHDCEEAWRLVKVKGKYFSCCRSPI